MSPTEEGDGRMIPATGLIETTGLPSPCKECPFSRSVAPGALGGSDVLTYIGQSYGPFWVPCHMPIDFNAPGWKQDYKQPQCAGHAIFKANCGYDKRMLSLPLHRLPADHAKVFSSPEELIAHHSPELLGNKLAADPEACYIREMAKIHAANAEEPHGPPT